MAADFSQLHFMKEDLKLLYNHEKGILKLPTEVLIQIFSFMSRNDLSECSLVCKYWHQIIEKHKYRLALHQLDSIKFTSADGWKILIEYGYLSILMRNRFNDDYLQFYGKMVDPDKITASCGKDVYLPLTDINCPCLTLHFSILLDETDTSKFSNIPPKPFFWQWLKRKLRHSTSDLLMFFDCYITEEFIDEFSAIIAELNQKNPYQINKLVMHGCHLCDLDTNKLYNLLFEQINAKSYIFSCISGCKEQDFQFNDISKFNSVQHARQLHFFGIRGEMASQLFNGPNDEELLSLIFSENSNFTTNLNSIQLPGFNLSKEFVEKFLSKIRLNDTTIRIQNIHIDDLVYQRLLLEKWSQFNDHTTQLKKYFNDYLIVVTHSPYRTTIYSKIYK